MTKRPGPKLNTFCYFNYWVYIGVLILIPPPQLEHQEEYHLFIGNPEEERSSDRGECSKGAGE